MAVIERVSLGKQIISSVLEILQRGDYQVGDQIPTEKELSQDLCVGRNSIREATKSLVLLGVLESIPGKGTFLKADPATFRLDRQTLFTDVKGISLQELIDARKIIEVAAAGLAATNVKGSPELAEKLEAAAAILSEGGYVRPEENLEDDPNSGYDLHRTVIALSGNRVLIRMMESIYEELKSARAMFPVTQEEYLSELAYHARIVEAIKSGDPDAAGSAMQAHLDNTEMIYARKQVRIKRK